MTTMRFYDRVDPIYFCAKKSNAADAVDAVIASNDDRWELHRRESLGRDLAGG